MRRNRSHRPISVGFADISNSDEFPRFLQQRGWTGEFSNIGGTIKEEAGQLDLPEFHYFPYWDIEGTSHESKLKQQSPVNSPETSARFAGGGVAVASPSSSPETNDPCTNLTHSNVLIITTDFFPRFPCL